MSDYLKVLTSPDRPKIAVVLGSGGLRAMGSVELLEFLEKAKIPIDLLIGCSGGSIIGSFYSSGYSCDEIRKITEEVTQSRLFTAINYKTIANLIGLPFGGVGPTQAFFKPDALKTALKKFLQDKRVENTKPKLLIQTTDIETGKGVLLSEGPLAEAVYASSAILPFLPAAEFDDKLLVDGAFSASLPVMPAITSEADIIIAMDFNSRKNFTPKNFTDYSTFFLEECDQNTVHLQNLLAIDLHHYEIIFISVSFDTNIPMWAHEMLPLVYSQAKEAVTRSKEYIIGAIEQFPHRKPREREFF